MHTMTPVVDNKTARGMQYSRLLWALEPNEYLNVSDVKAYGVYSFGGVDDTTGKCTNELT